MTEINNAASSTKLAVGTIIHCQLGNKSDTSGYEEAAQVEVLNRKDVICGGDLYLFRKVGTNLYGVATPVMNRSTGKMNGLYSTCAVLVGIDAKTEEQAIDMLGF